MKNIALALVLLFSIVVVLSFFLPWVSINSPVAGAISKVFSNKKGSSMMKISGYQVPILANRSDSRFMVQVIQLFNPGIKDADKKSWLIWGVPIFAIALFIASFLLNKNKWVNLGIGIIGALIFAVGVYKLKTTDLDKMVMNVTIMPGLWYTLIGYFGIGLSCLASFVLLLRKPKQ